MTKVRIQQRKIRGQGALGFTVIYYVVDENGRRVSPPFRTITLARREMEAMAAYFSDVVPMTGKLKEGSR